MLTQNKRKLKEEKKIICITGMPGAGKSTVCKIAETLGFEIIHMGNKVRLEAKKRNLELTADNLGKLMISLRKENGSAAIAKLCINDIKISRNKLFVIDGIRGMNEINEFKKEGKVNILTVEAAENTRYEFIKKRKREDVTFEFEEFKKRDSVETNIGILEVMKNCDYKIQNNNLTIKELETQAKIYLKDFM